MTGGSVALFRRASPLSTGLDCIGRIVQLKMRARARCRRACMVRLYPTAFQAVQRGLSVHNRYAGYQLQGRNGALQRQGPDSH